MFDKYMIVDDLIKNVARSGKIVGYQFGMRLPYYRGVVLSLIGNMVLTVDREVVPSEQISVAVAGKTFPLRNLANEPVLKWEFGEIGIVTVAKSGGLKPGMHVVDLQVNMDISYVPGGFDGHDCKNVFIAD